MSQAVATGSAQNERGERSARIILDAATEEFAIKGYDGARIDSIAARASANKRMLYHYFGSKDELYLAVLERTYADIRAAEEALDLTNLSPRAGVEHLVRFTWQYFLDHPKFLAILNNENLMRGQFLARSSRIKPLHVPLVDRLAALLHKGERDGAFRSGVDPVQLYITIAALGFFYLSNRYTLSQIFDRQLDTDSALMDRGEHIVDVVVSFLTHPAGAVDSGG
ncbi:MAG: TetR/AcrR family transcriptional regulator [Pseudomonadota bacterium]